MTGAIVKVEKVEPITEGEDLAHAKSQKAAMDRAKVKLAKQLSGVGAGLTFAVPLDFETVDDRRSLGSYAQLGSIHVNEGK
jgi:hypothetical protein